ncbi:hypothetical protein EVAR_79756_1 [Eumeta japonica]|uniref:Histone-lysine N-methyltransferase SETMAR n=1 Tax=Eumeta variegata TaxID=151549 RepID=A0A4C1TAC0_EUMVA|nr:hypothetical protein EVAR_79756_1 [Eumeta japonica]
MSICGVHRRPSTATTEDNISAVGLMIETNMRMIYQQIQKSLDSARHTNNLGTLSIEILAHPSCSPNLAPCVFSYLFPKMKEELLGKWFTDAEGAVAAYKKVVEVPLSASG